jgi:hypothetical protein
LPGAAGGSVLPQRLGRDNVKRPVTGTAVHE